MFEKSITGQFGITDKLEDLINGTLMLDEFGNVKLELNNSFSETIADSFNEIQNYVEFPKIIGYGSNGKYYELINCWSTGGNLNLGGLIQPKVYYTCEFVYEFPQNYSKEDSFDRISFSIDKLNQWCNIPSLKVNNIMHPTNVEFDIQTLWQQAKDGLEFKIGSGYKTSGEENCNYSVSFDYAFTIKFEPQKLLDVDIDKFIRIAVDFKTMLSLFVNESAKIYNITITNTKSTVSINLYCNYVQQNTEKSIDARKRISTFYLNDISKNLMAIFDCFKEKQESLGGSLSAIFKNCDLKKHRIIDIPDYIKQTATAIEGFMRNCRNLTIEEDQNIFKERLERLLENQTNDDAKWLKERLKYANQASFRKQLKLLFEEFRNNFEEHTKGILDDKKLENQIIDGYVNTRNFFTHYDMATKKKMLKNDTLVFLCDYINELLRLLILKEIGIDSEIVINRNSHNQLLIGTKSRLLECLKGEK